ncbi:MAG: hypothetical protein GY938_29460 [Ketobacter sp.]|nr:hypothetical protein [Ketobacter sp.]
MLDELLSYVHQNSSISKEDQMVSEKKHIERQRFIDYVSNPNEATSGFYLDELGLDEALNLIPLNFSKRSLYVVTGDGRHWYNLRGPNLQKLRDAVEQNAGPPRDGVSNLTESDKEILTTYQGSTIKFMWECPRGNVMPCGGFFAYWHTLPLDLTRYGLFASVPHYLEALSSKKDYEKLGWLLERVLPEKKAEALEHFRGLPRSGSWREEERGLDWIVACLRERFGLEDEKKFRELNSINSYRVCCLERAMLCWGLSKMMIETFYSLCPESHQNGIRYISRVKLAKIAKVLGINISLKTKWHVYKYVGSEVKKGDEESYYRLGEHENHYFALEQAPCTAWAIKHLDELDKSKPNWQFARAWRCEEKKTVKVLKSRALNSFALIKLLLETRNPEKGLANAAGAQEAANEAGSGVEFKALLVPIRGTEPGFKESIHFNSVCRSKRQLATLEYPNNSVRVPRFKEKLGDGYVNLLFWFDFEASTEGEYHQPYEVACVGEDGVMMYFSGPDPGALLLKALTKRVRDAQRKFSTTKIKCVLMAHYATYDFQFMVKHIVCRNDCIFTRSSVKLIKARYQWGSTAAESFKVWIKDTYVLIPMKLEKFASSFGLVKKDGSPLEKDVMPYGVMTQANMVLEDVPLEEARRCMEPANFEQLVKNIERLGLWANEKVGGKLLRKRFKHKAYSKYYCMLDVSVLRDGYNKWKQMIKEQTGFNTDTYLTLPQISYKTGHKRGVFDEVVEMSGIPREFHQRGVAGGQCMTRANKMWHVQEELDDCDCNSQYPSAMRFMGGFLKGAPKMLSEPMLKRLNGISKLEGSAGIMRELRWFDGYFLLIKVTKIARFLSFPLMAKRVEGIMQYRNELGRYYVNRFSLEDYVNFQGVEFEVVQGYYYDEGRNPKIASFIQGLYDLRLKYKREKNPVQKVLKELMNSFYGRTIMKPLEKETRFVYGKSSLSRARAYYHYCHNGDDAISLEEGNEIYTFEIEKSKGLHFSRPQVGAEILSFAKRIMNEAMVLAEELNIMIYYMDTDSMHIVKKDVQRLEREYEKKYGKELLGAGLGQFSCDFSVKGAADDPVSVEAFFLGKKVYLDMLRYHDRGGNEKFEMHIRMKGVPTPCVKQHAKGEGRSVKELYQDMYAGKTIEFDLLNRESVKPYFIRHKDFRHSNRGTFKRALSFKLPKGE